MFCETHLDRGEDFVHIASLLRAAGVSDAPLRRALYARHGASDAYFASCRS